jgi:hypothetical protein
MVRFQQVKLIFFYKVGGGFLQFGGIPPPPPPPKEKPVINPATLFLSEVLAVLGCCTLSEGGLFPYPYLVGGDAPMQMWKMMCHH